ncbi:hypothetical protein [Natronosalvus caseinilyticus]|uniref:hypothetical protein n=1 Tax=Natronosalvus caseinilyticus TaxID=2953747 RepID=UPI0028B17743|nr:hypothetical protein [Natronosalvus caseinilyticus]
MDEARELRAAVGFFAHGSEVLRDVDLAPGVGDVRLVADDVLEFVPRVHAEECILGVIDPDHSADAVGWIVDQVAVLLKAELAERCTLEVGLTSLSS